MEAICLSISFFTYTLWQVGEFFQVLRFPPEIKVIKIK
jgi:hypothetical protein